LARDEERRYLEEKVGPILILRRRSNGLSPVRGRGRERFRVPPVDPYLLKDVTTILIDCALRPEECFRLRRHNVRDGVLHVSFGKTENARRTVLLTTRAFALLEPRRPAIQSDWGFSAPTRSGHIEKSTLKKQHKKALKLSEVEPFTLYTLRHTCLTRWLSDMSAYTLAYLAGHADFATTKRYIHPQEDTVRAAMERARGEKVGIVLGIVTQRRPKRHPHRPRGYRCEKSVVHTQRNARSKGLRS
jgi:integrase